MARVNSEIGKLESVILHHPGSEVENMTPENAERALYSDILNPTVASREYNDFKAILSMVAQTYEVMDLLEDTLSIEGARAKIIEKIAETENKYELKDYLFSLTNEELARQLIEGVPIRRNTLTNFLSEERFSLTPLHNFFFTRDASMSFNDKVLIGEMHSKVRAREALIMDIIFTYNDKIKSETVHLEKNAKSFSIEGGDFLVVSENIFLIGNGLRTTTYAIDAFINYLRENTKEKKYIIVQELPTKLESFIHLDMIFTLLDKDACLIYEPVILNQHDYRTVVITIDNGKIKSIKEAKNILSSLARLGFDFEPIACGGETDLWIQQREQWHSGANFFAFEPGKILGYGRNQYTLEEINKHGYEVKSAKEIISGKSKIEDYKKIAVTIDGAELARGGGGCRCMTMPVSRKDVDW